MTGETLYLTIAEVLEMQRHLINEFGGMHGVRDAGLLASAVLRPQTGYYDDLLHQAAAMMESLANNHAFLDGTVFPLMMGDSDTDSAATEACVRAC